MKNTKGNRARAARSAMANIAQEATDSEYADATYFWSGRFSALETFAGYLSAEMIDKEISEAQEIIPDFTLAYELEMNQ
jgi:hypothetical protein